MYTKRKKHNWVKKEKVFPSEGIYLSDVSNILLIPDVILLYFLWNKQKDIVFKSA